MEHDIPFGNSSRENGTTFLDFPLFLGVFQWDEPTKRVPFTAEPEIPKILTKWKAPKNSGLKFRKLHVLNGTVHSGCTDPTQATARFVIVWLVSTLIIQALEKRKVNTVYILKNTRLSKRGGGKLKAKESNFV